MPAGWVSKDAAASDQLNACPMAAWKMATTKPAADTQGAWTLLGDDGAGTSTEVWGLTSGANAKKYYIYF